MSPYQMVPDHVIPRSGGHCLSVIYFRKHAKSLASVLKHILSNTVTQNHLEKL